MILRYCLPVLLVVFSSVSGHAQTQPPPTADELGYFRYVLMTVANPAYSPDFVKGVEDSVAAQCNLNSDEMAVLHSAALSFRPTLQALQKSAASLMQGTGAPTVTDLAALNALAAQRDSAISALATNILNSVRQETAELLRVPGHIVSAAQQASKGE